MFTTGVLTISDKGSRRERIDKSGADIKEMVSQVGGNIVCYDIVPDEKEIISRKLIEWADSGDIDVILTTGGTGLGPRDVTPEATMPVLDRLVPGIAEAMRLKTMEKAPTSVLSRAISGVRNNCLIINLPGNPKAVRECLDIALPVIPHAIEIIKGIYTEHKAEDKLVKG